MPCPAAEAAAGASCTLIKQGSPVYWPVGLALAYAATAFFYIRRSRNRGVGTPSGRTSSPGSSWSGS
ncbi:hypothetical protein ACFQ1I_43895 [Kitasatospora arboriphila]